jgi:DNA repair protein RecN (Recombination protein N)
MLCRLSVNNYALIRNLDIEFGKPFSVITGETGAGKSIILGALSLILGNRADNITFVDPTKKCSVEGTFDISKCELETFFDDNNLDYDSQCIIRREITPQGKSRAFINDTPVNLSQLKEITGRLIDVHSQHQTLLLRENSFQLSVVDAVADNNKLLKKYKETYKKYRNLKRELEETRVREQKEKTELDYLVFIVEELRNASLTKGEQDQLEQDLEVQSHAEEIRSKLYMANGLLNEDDENLIKKLKEVFNNVSAASRYYADLKVLSERIDSTLLELKDIAEVISDTMEKIQYNPELMSQINYRLNIIYRLEQKHHAKDIDELLVLAENYEKRISGIESLDQKISELEKKSQECYKELIEQSDELSQRRRSRSSEIERSIEETISLLGIKDGKFSILWHISTEPSADGSDEVKFLFSANRGSAPNDISKIASGGELSRLMLAVKSLISTNNLLPTIVFDEIDTGISGEIAGKVGNILRKISKHMQVITITHLPQIAALGNEHFKVYKLTDSTSTWSDITLLNQDEQINELALMISGDNKLQGAREAALELLNLQE